MNNWCITYRFDSGLPVKDQISTYENIGLKLYYSDVTIQQKNVRTGNFFLDTVF
jgi:hypothetical protein